MNIEEIYKQIEDSRQARLAELKLERAKLREQLQALGVTRLEANYSGYGDSGNVDDIELYSGEALLKPEHHTEELTDFVWGLAYNTSPGFENNEGGDGELSWDIEADEVTIEHRTFFIESSSETFEGV